jgi:hypothetical protein
MSLITPNTHLIALDSLLAPKCREAADCFANGLNAILLAYQTEFLGDMRYNPGPDDLIFVTNNSASAAFEFQTIVAGTSLSSLAQDSRIPVADAKRPLAQWLRRLQTKAWKSKNDPCSLSWQAVWHCWGLTRETPLSSVEFPVYSLADVLGQGTKSFPHLAGRLADRSLQTPLYRRRVESANARENRKMCPARKGGRSTSP